MDEHAATATIEYQPRLSDTYALVYAFALLFLVPGTALLSRLPFGDARTGTYSFAYVSLVTLPFVLGLVAALMTDHRDTMRTVLIRIAILTPVVVVTAVTIMFTSSIALVPVSGFIRPENFSVLTPIAAGLLLAVASPLAVALVRKLKVRRGVDVLHAAVIGLAILLVLAVVYLTLTSTGSITGMARKDTVIYVIGAVTWYLPSFGLAAGIWRSVGLV